jgi:hypothetical protein
MFEGELEVTNTVLIDKEGLASANVTAEHVIVQGAIIGNIRAKRIEIHANGKVWGNISAHSICVEPGGFVRGQIVISHKAGHELDPLLPESLKAPDFLSLEASPDDDLARLFVELATTTRPSPTEETLFHQPNQAAMERLTANLDAAYQRVEQLTAERDALETTVTQLTQDLYIAKHQKTHPTSQLVQIEKATERYFGQSKPEESQIANAPIAADRETTQPHTAQPAPQLDEQVEEEKGNSSLQAGEVSQDHIEQMHAYIIYCLICRAYRHIEGVREFVTPDGHPAVKGRCVVCGMSLVQQI